MCTQVLVAWDDLCVIFLTSHRFWFEPPPYQICNNLLGLGGDKLQIFVAALVHEVTNGVSVHMFPPHNQQSLSHQRIPAGNRFVCAGLMCGGGDRTGSPTRSHRTVGPCRAPVTLKIVLYSSACSRCVVVCVSSDPRPRRLGLSSAPWRSSCP